MPKKVARNSRGFTLVELMIVVSIIGILSAIAAPNFQMGIIRAREAVLAEDLYNFRTTIDQFKADLGKYPDSLQDLVDKKYLRSPLPSDPFTKRSDTWVIVAPAPTEGQQTQAAPQGSVYDVHSGSNLIGSNNIPYNEW
jgi:general secretion pathway protein G